MQIIIHRKVSRIMLTKLCKMGNVTQELLVAIMKQMNETEKKHDEHLEKIQKQLEEEKKSTQNANKYFQ